MRIILIPLVRKSTIFTLLAVSATLFIWNSSPFVAWGYETAVFVLAAWTLVSAPSRWPVIAATVASIGLWGFGQLVVGATVYRWATVNAALQNIALMATFAGAYLTLSERAERAKLLRLFSWLGCGIALIGVTAYWTSPGKILWIYPAVYPDNWGLFPSRNNFAQFLEVCFPVAIYEASRARLAWPAAISPVVILGAGLASASRAGAILLLTESAAALWLLRRRLPLRRIAALALAAIGFASIAGVGALLHRFAEPDPLELRREIFGSSLAMIAEHPWKGFGLGTYATVYPEFAEFDSGASVEHAHDDWLEWTAEGGLIYTSLWACLAIWAIRPAIHSLWGLGIPAVFLHAVVDYPFARLGVSAWVFLLLGALAQEQRKVLARAHYAMGESGETEKPAVLDRPVVQPRYQRSSSGRARLRSRSVGRAAGHRDGCY